MAWNPKYSVNTNKLINRNFGSKPREVRKQIREVVSSSAFKEELGMLYIDKIVQRTKDGIDKDGKSFAGYSDSYKNSLAFQIAGKGSNVDLTLTGEMLASLQAKASGAEVEINLIDARNKGKAHGLITGKNGRWSAKRDFLGLPESEEDRIFKDLVSLYSSDVNREVDRLRDQVLTLGTEGGTEASSSDVALLFAQDLFDAAI